MFPSFKNSIILLLLRVEFILTTPAFLSSFMIMMFLNKSLNVATCFLNKARSFELASMFDSGYTLYKPTASLHKGKIPPTSVPIRW